MTRGVSETLELWELTQIQLDVQLYAKREDGIDYLQEYRSDDGRTVWCIDNLNDEMKADPENSPEFKAENDYWTMILPSEY